ncbi:MAG: RNA 2',3'-cyclic phosphodiesterase [Candidatus Diapherotrites archaeon]|nr:RNA 2',3'-cyclic phosphodiesterase [Candidatus Diapherotrites archaeon]
MRLFVGVPLPDVVRTELWKYWQQTQRQGQFGNYVKPVEPENYHITLKFIGEVPEQRAARIQRTLEEVQIAEPFGITISGIGGFPTVANAKVIWAGVQDGFQELIALSEHIDTILAYEGVPRERKAFHPHVTLARVKRGTANITDIARVPKTFGAFKYHGFVLYKSTLTPEGPIYEEIQRYEVRK